MREVYPRTHTHARTVPRRGGGRRGVKGWKFRPRPPITHRASSKSRRVNAAKASKYARVFSRKGHLKNSFACAFLPPPPAPAFLNGNSRFSSLSSRFPSSVVLAVSGTAKRSEVKKRRHPIFLYSFISFLPLSNSRKDRGLEFRSFRYFLVRLSEDIPSKLRKMKYRRKKMVRGVYIGLEKSYSTLPLSQHPFPPPPLHTPSHVYEHP